MQRMETDLQQRLVNDYQTFISVINGYSSEAFNRHADEKWSVADVVQHLYLSARPVARLMTGPREVFMQWGKPASPSKTYEEIASAYKKILATGVKAPAAMAPRIEDMQVGRDTLMTRFSSVYESLIETIGHWSDQELEAYCIPHPALGKLTVREMVNFTSLHTQHHLRLLPKP